jgi:hypothetical protein
LELAAPVPPLYVLHKNQPMKRSLKSGIFSGIAAIVVAVSLVAALSKTENDFFQFCTTKAYGWPAPWKIDYCECEGSKTVYPTTSKIANSLLVVGSGIAGFALFSANSMLRNRRKKPKQNNPCVATGDSAPG